ncbi:MAG: glycosyltransferase family 9 protein [Verrucomicrobiales bacterium]
MPWQKRALARVFGIAAAVLRVTRALRTSRVFHSSPRTVILEPFGMGDVISLQPLVDTLLGNGIHVTLCARHLWRNLYPARANFEWLDCHVPWSSYDERRKYRPGVMRSQEFRHFVSHLRSMCRDAIGIDTRGDVRSILLLYLAGCRKVISLSHYLGYDLSNTRGAAHLVPYDDGRRRWELNLQFLRPLGLPMPARAEGPRFKHLRGSSPLLTRARIGLLPTAPWPGRLWADSNWRELAGLLRSDGLDVVGLCGPRQSAEAERALGKEVPIEECASIESWAKALGELRLLVTLDTGPMHLADALEVPVVVLYGTGKLPLWAPSGSLSRIIHRQASPDFRSCHPSPNTISFGQTVMNRTTVNEVLDTVLQVDRRIRQELSA